MKDVSLRLYHNARCSKSRAACSLLAERNIEPVIVNYLETPPTRKELQELASKLGMAPSELVRRGEPIYIELYAGRELSEEAWLEALVAHPILLERPILVCGEKAVIGRPPERVLELLQGP